MMNISTTQELAERFHEAYERLAPSFGYTTRQETRTFDPESPNGKLMIAVCTEVLAHPLEQVVVAKNVIREALEYGIGLASSEQARTGSSHSILIQHFKDALTLLDKLN